MTNEEIKALIRELARSADEDAGGRSRTVRITFDSEEEEKTRGRKHRRNADRETEADVEAAAPEETGAEAETAGAPEDGRADSDSDSAPEETADGRRENSFSWELPEDDADEDEEEDVFISILPKREQTRESASRPGNYRDGKRNPQETSEAEEDGEEEESAGTAARASSVLREAPRFETDAADFRTAEDEETDAAAGTGKAGAALAGLAGGLSGLFSRRGGRKKAEEDGLKDGADDSGEDEASRTESGSAGDGEESSAAEESGAAGDETGAAEGTGSYDGGQDSAGAGSMDSAGEESDGTASAGEVSDSSVTEEMSAGASAGDGGEGSAAEGPGADADESRAAEGSSVPGRSQGSAGDGSMDPAADISAGDGSMDPAADISAGDDRGDSTGTVSAGDTGESAGGEDDGRSAAEASAGEGADGAAGEESSEEEGSEETDEARSEEKGDRAEKDRPSISERLEKKGLGIRELALGAAGVVLVVLIAVIGIHLLRGSGGRKITSDEGLTVTVVNEPAEWTSRAKISLDIRTTDPIRSVSIDGENAEVTGTNRTKVEYEAKSSDLTVAVVTEDRTLNAEAQIAFIDSEPPVLSVSENGGKIVLAAADEQSGVEGIYVGTVTGFSDVPAYEPYTEPFVPEKDTVYSCFAMDLAGNGSVPLVTDFSAPEQLLLDRDKITLFPGQTAVLPLRTVPEHAWLRDLTMTNSDSAVISLDSLGNIQSLAEGDSRIEISYPGLEPLSCLVSVKETAEITVSAVGDVTMGDDAGFSPQSSFSTAASANGLSFFFDNVRDIFKEDDLTFANLEGTLTTQGERENKQYAFRGDPSYVEILKDGGVDAVTLANNHSSDYGEISLTDTEKYLDEAGIAWCNGDKIAFVDAGGIRTALVGIYVLKDGMGRRDQVETVIKQAKEEGADLVIAAFHWGSENSTYPDETQQSLAHIAVDSGADLVVGHHPHVLQGIEIYRDKYIVYSLANFCFGGNSNPSDSDTMIFRQNFSLSRDGTLKPGAVSIIPCSVSSVNGWNNYQPTPAAGTEAQRIEEKIRSLSEQLGTTLESDVFA